MRAEPGRGLTRPSEEPSRGSWDSVCQASQPAGGRAPGAGQDVPASLLRAIPGGRGRGDFPRAVQEGSGHSPACELRVRCTGDGEATCACPQPSPPAAQVRASPPETPAPRAGDEVPAPLSKGCLASNPCGDNTRFKGNCRGKMTEVATPLKHNNVGFKVLGKL